MRENGADIHFVMSWGSNFRWKAIQSQSLV